MRDEIIRSEAVKLTNLLTEPDGSEQIYLRIKELAAKKWPRQKLLNLLESIRPHERSQCLDDKITDVMDCVVGHCHPEAKIETIDTEP